jgi:Bacterial Ig-like domain
MFSEQMMGTYIDGNTFQLLLKDGTTTKILATVTYDADVDPLTATLDPNEPLRRGVTYKAVITTGAKDLAGNFLDQVSTASSQQKAWSFTTSS